MWSGSSGATVSAHDERSRRAELARTIALHLAPAGTWVDYGGALNVAAVRRDGAGLSIVADGASAALGAWLRLRAETIARIVVLEPSEAFARLAAALRGTPTQLGVIAPGSIEPVEPWRPRCRTRPARDDAWLDALEAHVGQVGEPTRAVYEDAELVEVGGIPVGGWWRGAKVVGVDGRDWLLRAEQHLDDAQLLAQAAELTARLCNPADPRARSVVDPSRFLGRRLRAQARRDAPLEPLEPEPAGGPGSRAFALGPEGVLWGFGRGVDPWLAVEARALAGPSGLVRLVVAGDVAVARRFAAAFEPMEVSEG